jgi:hypothetical protein
VKPGPASPASRTPKPATAGQISAEPPDRKKARAPLRPGKGAGDETGAKLTMYGAVKLPPFSYACMA